MKGRNVKTKQSACVDIISLMNMVLPFLNMVF